MTTPPPVYRRLPQLNQTHCKRTPVKHPLPCPTPRDPQPTSGVLTRNTGVRVRSGRPGRAFANFERKASMAWTESVLLSAVNSCE